MDIASNFTMLIKQICDVFSAFGNRTLILVCSAQVASMITKMIISAIKCRKFSFNNMFVYGGMPSSHTVFVMSWVMAAALDPELGWKNPILPLGIITSAIILMDAVRLRGSIDKLNEQVKILSDKVNISLELPKFVAHKPSEVVGGIIFSFIYTFLFYLFFYNLF